jgi:hypothetical protein
MVIFLGELQGIVCDKFYFSFPTIKEDSKKLKTMKISAVVLKKSGKNLVFWPIFQTLRPRRGW